MISSILILLAIISGSCGDESSYNIDTENYSLNIFGKGSIYFSSYNEFYSCKSYINTIFINDGITMIGPGVFSNLDNLISIHFAQTITSIGIGAFHNCRKLESIDLPDSILSVDSSAFELCISLRNISLSKSMSS